jgi:hypothetical protein
VQSPESDPRKKLAFDESIRSLTLQSSVLDDLRSRTGILLTAVSLTATFLGSKALQHGFTFWTEVGLGCFLVSGGFCLAVLWPSGSWNFVFNAKTILDDYVAGDDPADLDEMLVEFAERNQENWTENDVRLARLFWFFRLAVLALIGQLPCWLIAIGKAHG